MSDFIIRTAGITDIGSVRTHNEDSIGIDEVNKMVVVADGMGGHSHGGKASSIAVDTVLQFFRNSKEPTRIDNLAMAFHSANDAVRNKLAKYNSGTTIVGVHVCGKLAAIANAGDSRCYLIRNGKIKQITEDHSVIEEAKKTDPNFDPKNYSHMAHAITNAAGLAPKLRVDIVALQIKDKDLLLLCTDGLTNELEDREILGICLQSQGLAEACINLVTSANEKGGRDNITVALVKVNDEKHYS